MTPKQNEARLLYMADDKSQKDIASHVGVSERTIYTWIRHNGWDRLRQAARSAPIIATDNLFSQLIELQDSIAAREPGKRFPTMQEADLTRKLVLSIDKMKSSPSLSQSMQVLHIFRSFVSDSYDLSFRHKLNRLIENFLEGEAKNGYRPYQAQYGPAITPDPDFSPDDPVPSPPVSDDTLIAGQDQAAPGSCASPSDSPSAPRVAPAEPGSDPEAIQVPSALVVELPSRPSAPALCDLPLPSATTSAPISAPAEAGSKTEAVSVSSAVVIKRPSLPSVPANSSTPSTSHWRHT